MVKSGSAGLSAESSSSWASAGVANRAPNTRSQDRRVNNLITWRILSRGLFELTACRSAAVGRNRFAIRFTPMDRESVAWRADFDPPAQNQNLAIGQIWPAERHSDTDNP